MALLCQAPIAPADVSAASGAAAIALWTKRAALGLALGSSGNGAGGLHLKTRFVQCALLHCLVRPLPALFFESSAKAPSSSLATRSDVPCGITITTPISALIPAWARGP